MRSACVILGKYGDIFSGLPFVQETGSTLIVSQKYRSAVDGIPGLKTSVLDTSWANLAGAIKYAKRHFPHVLIPQTFGESLPIRHTQPSWQHDQWARAGILSKFDTLPLLIPRTNDSRKQAQTILADRRTILVAPGSESSPFPHKEKLFSMLQDRFGTTHQISDLSAIKLDRFRDFLSLYDRAECLVSVDTAHLHLSAASKVPTVALVTNQPQHWHGSAWSRRFLIHCRYNEFEARIEEVFRAVKLATESKRPTQFKALETKFMYGYNPSFINFDGRFLMSYRYHPEPTKWRTLLALDDGRYTLPIDVPKQWEEHSFEDGRLFTFKGKLHISFVISSFPASPTRCVCGYAQLVHDAFGWSVKEIHIPIYGRNDFSGMEKNFVFFESGEKLFAIYGSSPLQTVIEVAGNRVTCEHKAAAPAWDHGTIHGGAILQKGDIGIRYFHSKTGNAHRNYEFRYHIGKLRMSMTPPFKIIDIDPEPVISGNEMFAPSCRHWKPNVVFPGGVVEQHGKAIVAVGWNDCRCATLEQPL